MMASHAARRCTVTLTLHTSAPRRRCASSSLTSPGPTCTHPTLTTSLSHTVHASGERHTIGADFHRAMVATAPGEKLLIGRRPAGLVFVQKITKITAPELQLLTPVCTNRLSACAVFRGPTSKVREWRGRERSRGEGREGVRPLP